MGLGIPGAGFLFAIVGFIITLCLIVAVYGAPTFFEEMSQGQEFKTAFQDGAAEGADILGDVIANGIGWVIKAIFSAIPAMLPLGLILNEKQLKRRF